MILVDVSRACAAQNTRLNAGERESRRGKERESRRQIHILFGTEQHPIFLCKYIKVRQQIKKKHIHTQTQANTSSRTYT